MKYYKVVKRCGEQLHSVSASAWSGMWLTNPQRFNLEYTVGKLVYPKVDGSKIFCFSKLESAKHFLGQNDCCEIYECLVFNPTKKSYYCSNLSRIDARFNKNQAIEFDDISKVYPNTVFCDAVCLVKKVTNVE